MEETKLNRRQLYDLVWSVPLLRLSKMYCISDNGLRKMCKSMNIPLPPNGYWMKIKHGKQVKKPRLPKQNTGKEEFVLKPRTENCNELSVAMSAQSKLVQEILSHESLVLDVPERLSSRPYPLIKSTRAYRNAAKNHDWKRGGLYPDRDDLLNIDVSKESLPRAFRLLDTMIKLLRSRHHEVKVVYGKTVVVIQGEEIEFRLREKQQVVKQGEGYGSREMAHTGILIFYIGRWGDKRVSDGKQKLESKLAVFLAKLELEDKREHEDSLRREKIRMEREEQGRIEWEIRERKEAELKRFTDLFKSALQLHHAMILRKYVEEIQDKDNVGEVWNNWVKKD